MSTTPPPAFELPAVPNLTDIEKVAKPVITQAADLIIKDEDGYIAAWSLVEMHDRAIATITEKRDPFVQGLHKLHKMALHLFDPWLEPLTASRQRLLDERTRYRIEQETAAKKARDAEAERIRKETARQLEADAKKLQKRDPETAAVLREQAKNVPPPNLPTAPAVSRQAGSVITERWKCEVFDPELVPRELCEPALKKINSMVTALGDKANIPGVRVWKETSESSRTVKP